MKSPENRIDKLMTSFIESAWVRYFSDMAIAADQFWVENLIATLEKSYESITGLQITVIPKEVKHRVEAIVHDLLFEIDPEDRRRMRIANDPKIEKIMFLGLKSHHDLENLRLKPDLKIMVIVDDDRSFLYYPGEIRRPVTRPQANPQNILADRLSEISTVGKIDLQVISRNDVVELQIRTAGMINRLKTDEYQVKVLEIMKNMRRGLVVYDHAQQK